MPTAKEPRLVEIQVDSQLTETIRQLHEVSSRIDERIKHLIEKQNGMADRLEKIGDTVFNNATRLAILEQADIDQLQDGFDEVDKKLAVLEKQLNNGIRSDVDDMKIKVRTLELSNEHNTSFRTKGEARLEWWLNVAWKVVQIIGGTAIAYYMAKK